MTIEHHLTGDTPTVRNTMVPQGTIEIDHQQVEKNNPTNNLTKMPINNPYNIPINNLTNSTTCQKKVTLKTSHTLIKGNK